jgi:hypothetical protein
LSKFKQKIDYELSKSYSKNITEAKVIQSPDGQSTVSTQKKDFKTNDVNFNQQFKIVEPSQNLIINDEPR